MVFDFWYYTSFFILIGSFALFSLGCKKYPASSAMAVLLLFLGAVSLAYGWWMPAKFMPDLPITVYACPLDKAIVSPPEQPSRAKYYDWECPPPVKKAVKSGPIILQGEGEKKGIPPPNIKEGGEWEEGVWEIITLEQYGGKS